MDAWPSLSYAAWKDTYATLLRWTQIVGKIRLVQTPWVNHSWHVVYYVTARGLSTSPIRHGERVFQIDFDFIDHQLVIQTGEGERRTLRLEPRTVADFYQALMALLAELDLRVAINTTPNEQVEAIPFDKDQKNRSYDADAVRRFFAALLQAGFPKAQMMVCGVLGPKSNAHGPNEFLHVPYAKRLTAAVAQVVAAHP